MSFNAQIPGTIQLTKVEFNEIEVPSAGGGGGVVQQSCYSFKEKISGITNPVCLQHDVMYANAFAAIIEQNNSCENESPLALGCIGHKTDREFPLESKTPTSLPLVMYLTATNGNSLDEVDICAKPVLNWELYIQDVKAKTLRQHVNKCKSSKHGKGKNIEPEEDDIPEYVVSDSEESFQNACLENANSMDEPIEGETPNSKDVSRNSGMKVGEKDQKIVNARALKKVRSQVEQDSKTKQLSQRRTNQTRKKEQTRSSDTNAAQHASYTGNTISFASWKKLKNQPKIRIEGTWNHLYGGGNGALCFMKSASNSCLYVGKGSKLRVVILNESKPASIFSYNVNSVWDEDQVPSLINARGSNDCDPFDEIIFQVIPNENNKIVGARRGRSIHIYDTENCTPVLLESVPNMFYGTKEYTSCSMQSQRKIKNPFLRGFDFSPTNGPEIISIDENHVVRVCNIYKRSTTDLFVLPTVEKFGHVPAGYPTFKLNDAAGISFANHDKIFYAWGDSVVYMGDRRSSKYSRSQIVPLFNLRTHVYSHALSSQNYFHEANTKLNEYVSCLKRSKRDFYYYVGTTSKIYLMDLRVPFHPVIAVSHGLQSPLTYMDTYSDKGENFETIVGGSQRMQETVCLSSDFGHLECRKRPGCKARQPLLYSYPRHLSNPRNFFDAAVNEGYDFPYPVDHEVVKEHCYAWATGLAVLPISGGNYAYPQGMVLATNNCFGDVFWQEWEQRPISSHKSHKFSDYKLTKFLTEWQKAMTSKLPTCHTDFSKNPHKSVDCTLLVEPLAEELETLSRVRAVSFNCFQSNLVDRRVKQSARPGIEDLCKKFRRYTSSQAKTILNVWRVPETISEAVEEIEIKLEHSEWPHLLSPTTSTVEIPSDDEQMSNHEQDPYHSLHIEHDIHNDSNAGVEDNIDYFLETSQLSQWPDNNYDGIEDTQTFRGDDEIQENLLSSQPTSSRPKNIQKTKRSGFL